MNFQLNLNSETVEHAYSVDPICLKPGDSVREAMRQMRDTKTGAVLVCLDGTLTGIFTERDAIRMLASSAKLNDPLEAHMARDPVTISEEDTVGKAIAKMSYGGYRRLPIVDDKGSPKGILTTSGILHYLVEHFRDMIYNLPPSPHHSTQQREGA